MKTILGTYWPVGNIYLQPTIGIINFVPGAEDPKTSGLYFCSGISSSLSLGRQIEAESTDRWVHQNLKPS